MKQNLIYIYILSLFAFFFACGHKENTKNNLRATIIDKQSYYDLYYHYSLRATKDTLHRVASIIDALRESEKVQHDLFLKTYISLYPNKSITKLMLNTKINHTFSDTKMDSTLNNLYKILVDKQYAVYNLYPEYINATITEKLSSVEQVYKTNLKVLESNLALITGTIEHIEEFGSDYYLNNSYLVCEKSGEITVPSTLNNKSLN